MQTNASYIAPGASTVFKARMAAPSNVPSLSGLGTYDGITGDEGDIIFLWNQSTASQNGIYLITAKTSTALTLVKQADPTNGNLVFVRGGNSNKNYYFQKNSNTYTRQVIQPKIVSYDRGRPNITQPITF